MQKLSIFKKVLLGALLLGSGAAFAGNYALNHQGNETLYNWESHKEGRPDQNGLSRDAAISFYGCEEGNVECATGTEVGGSAQIKLMQN